MISTWAAPDLLIARNVFDNPNGFTVIRTADGVSRSCLSGNHETCGLAGHFFPIGAATAGSNSGLAPSERAWMHGDVVWNSHADAAEPLGWVFAIMRASPAWVEIAPIPRLSCVAWDYDRLDPDREITTEVVVKNAVPEDLVMVVPPEAVSGVEVYGRVEVDDLVEIRLRNHSLKATHLASGVGWVRVVR